MTFLSGLIGYIVSGILYMKLFQKAGIRNYWLAWVPVANLWPLMWLIGRSSWNILWFLVPVANIIFAIYMSCKVFLVFGRSGWHILWNLIPFVGAIIYLVMLFITAFDDRYHYQLPGPYGNSGNSFAF